MLNVFTAILIFLALKENIKRLYLYAFFAGLFTDLYFGGVLGFTSVFNLVLIFLVFLFKLRFAYNWRWAIIFVILSQVVWYYAWRFNF